MVVDAKNHENTMSRGHSLRGRFKVEKMGQKNLCDKLLVFYTFQLFEFQEMDGKATPKPVRAPSIQIQRRTMGERPPLS